MYATLEEAYETPSIARQKKRRARPDDSTREDFTSGAGSNSDSLAQQKHNFLSTAPKESYSGKLNDYTYGCKQYGICPKTLIDTKEGFENASVKPSSRGPPLTKLSNKCAPLSPPNYEFPMTEKDKRRQQAAMDAALREDYEAPPVVKKPSRMVDMSTVDGYADDDLDQYLSLDNMKDQVATPPIVRPKGPAADPYDPDSSPFAELLREAASRRRESARQELWDMTGTREKQGGINQEKGESTAAAPMWMDLLLFALIGVLVILIMDQLFRLAMVAGMKQTLEILRPFLEVKRGVE